MSSATRRLWLLLLVAAVLVTATASSLGAPEGDTIVQPLRRFLLGYQQTDSWRPMAAAEQYVSSPHSRPVYQEMLDVRHVKFQYPLTSLLFTRALDLEWLKLISWFSVVALVAANWWILRLSGGGTPLEFRADDPAVGLAVIGLSLSFFPVLVAYSLGQIQAWINALLALALLAWVGRRDDLAGVAVGLACLMKPTYLVLAVWGLLRWRVRFLVPMAGVLVLGGLASLVAYGLADNVDYLHALRTIGRQGEAFLNNQSFNGLLNRLLENGDALRFDRSAFAPFHPVVYVGTLAAFVALTALALWLPPRVGAGGSAEDFSIALLTLTVTSPVAWTHHYGALLPILFATAPAMLRTRAFGVVTGLVLCVCYVIASQSPALLAQYQPAVIASPLLLAALCVLVMLYRTSATRSSTPTTAATPPPVSPVTPSGPPADALGA